MTTPSTERKAGPLLGTGSQTTWPFTFKVFAATDIAVTIANSLGVETQLTFGVDYTVTLNSNQETSPGGTVTYPISGSPLPVGSRLVIVGNLPYDQPLDLPSGGNFSPLALENQLDRTVMQIQQLRENVGRALQLPVTAAGTLSVQLPQPEPNELLGWDPTGQNLQNFAVSELATAVAYATMRYDTFTGDGVETQFTLTADPVTLANLDVAISGVTQVPGSDYSLVNGVLVFTSAPANGTQILARYGEGLVNVGGDSSDIRFLQAGANAVDRTVEGKLRDVISVKDFGAVGDGITPDTVAVQNAINYAASIGGGVIYFPAATYVGDMITISGDNITLLGYGASLKNFRFTFTSTSSNITLKGFYVYDDTGNSSRYFLEIQGNRLTLEDCTFEFINHLQALGWVRRNVSYLYFTRVRAIKGGLNIFGGGTDYHFTDCVWEDGTDDAIALKAPALDANPLVTQNITIQGGRVKNHAALLSIGSDVGRAGADGYTAAVRNVTMTNVTGVDTASILFIKPGIISGSDWRDGTVENITVSNCTLTDTTGAKYKRAIDIQAGRGAIVNNVIVSNCAVYARCPAIITDHAFVYLKTVAEGDPALIKNIFINDCSFIDIYDGAANGIGAPGYPTTQAVYGEQANGLIQNVVIDNCLMRGTRDSGVFCDIADLTVRNTTLQKIANNPVATFSGFWNGDNLTQYKNNNIEVLNGLAIGYTSGSGGGDFDATAETSIVSLGSAAAGTDVSATSFVAPTDCYIWKIVLVNTAAIAQSNTDYLQIRFYNHSTAAYLIQTDTTLTGLNITAFTGVSVNGANAFTGANAYLPKGGILSFSTVNQGAGKPLTNMYAVVYYVPYGL